MKLTPRIGNTSNIELYGLQVKRDQVSSIRVYMENGDADDVYLCATRADFCEAIRTGESADTAMTNGQELIDEGLIFAKVGAGAWANICGWANKMQIGPINEQEYVDVQIKSVLPVGLSSVGTIQAGLAFRVAGTQADDSLLPASAGVTISGGAISELNQVYTFLSAGILTSATDARLEYSSDGYWRVWSSSIAKGAIAKGGNISNIPARGWVWINRARDLPNVILGA